MRLYQQLVLFMLAATVLPLALVGFLLLSRAEGELAARLDAEQRTLAAATAEGAAAELLATVDALARSAELIDWERASPEERRGALSLLYGQSPVVSAVLQVDADGRGRHPARTPARRAAGPPRPPAARRSPPATGRRAARAHRAAPRGSPAPNR